MEIPPVINVNNPDAITYRYDDGAQLQNEEFSDGSGLELYETGSEVMIRNSLDSSRSIRCRIERKFLAPTDIHLIGLANEI